MALEDEIRDMRKDIGHLTAAQAGLTSKVEGLAEDIKEVKNDVKGVAAIQSTVNNLVAEHKERGCEFDACKKDVAALKQCVGLKEDGSSTFRDIYDVVKRHDIYFVILIAVGAGLWTLSSGVLQAGIKKLIGL